MTIAYYDSGVRQAVSFRKVVNSLDELKTAFLKRFGNINSAPNKAMKEKDLVKRLTYSATSLNDWVDRINTTTRWELHIRQV